MGRELGRISGPLLADNLLRNGKNLAFESKLLYFDVVNKRIGINTSIPTRDLTVAGTTDTTDILVDTAASLANLEFTTNQIQNVIGDIVIAPNQSTDPTVILNRLQVGDIELYTNTITNTVVDENLVFDPTGKLVFGTLINPTSVQVNGNLGVTGNLTLDGKLSFGNDTQDNVVFNADVNSDFIPAVSNTFAIGSPTKEWSKLYSHNINASTIDARTGATVDGIDLLLSPGNTYYVSVNGNDANIGTHLQGTFRSVKHALSVAQSGDEIVIFPGTYVEEWPLTVPQGVSVRGAGIRSVAIEPTLATNTKDCFLLNGETTVSFLTVKNFFKDEINNTGYAFRFAPSIKVTTRSPYVFNVTVITRGSVTSSSDPVGYNQNDAGGGAYIDGSVADATSAEASALFFSATFIVPNNVGIHVTNGARVEWLNSFSYFAKRGIYLTQGTLGFASQGVRFGAEMRSINSANVYGEFGAVADGADTLGYLIGHNFGYIGSGGDSNNDYGLVIQANEIVPVNGGQLYYDSMDHKGDFRIGDIFHVIQETGQVEFNAQTINLGASGSIALESEAGRTYIDLRGISSDNIFIHDNDVDSLTGPININPFSGVLNINDAISDTTTVSGNLNVTGNVSIDGTLITFGNTITDTVTIIDYFSQNINPKTNNAYSLGSLTSRWNTAFIKNSIDVGNQLSLANNSITSLQTNANIVFAPNGTGKLVISDSFTTNQNLTIGQNLTVSGTTGLKSTSLTSIIQTGSLNQTIGSTDITGALSGRVITGESNLYLPGINVVGNTISSITTDTDFTISANGVGKVYVPYNDVIIDQALSVGGNLQQTANLTSFGNLDLNGTLTQFGDFNQIGDYTTGTVSSGAITLTGTLTLPAITVAGNTISGTLTNTNVVFVANGTGKVVLNNTSASFGQDLLVNGDFTLGNNAFLGNFNTGDITQVGNFTRTGNADITGTLTAPALDVYSSNYVNLGNFSLDNQTISGIVLDDNLYYTADGTGVVKIGSSLFIHDREISATVVETYLTEDGETFITEDGEEFVTEGETTSLDIQITPNAGSFVVNSTSFLKVPTSSDLDHLLSLPGEIKFNPATSSYFPGVYGLEGYDTTGPVWFMNVFSADRQTGIFEDSNVINFFTDDGTVRSYIDSTKWTVNNDLQIGNLSFVSNNIANVNPNNDVTIPTPGTGQVMLNDLSIHDSTFTTPTDGPLVLSSTGSGYIKFAGTNGVVLGVGDTTNYPAAPEVGTVRYNTELNYPEVYDAVQGWIPFSGKPITENELIDINDLWALILG